MKKLWMWLFKDGHGIWLLFAIVAYVGRVILLMSHTDLPFWVHMISVSFVMACYIVYVIFGLYLRFNTTKNINWKWMIAASLFLSLFVYYFPWGAFTIPLPKAETGACIGFAASMFSLFSYGMALMEFTDAKKMKGDKDTDVDMTGIGL